MKYKNKWDLSKIYSSIDAWENAFILLKKRIARFETLKNNIDTKSSSKEILKILQLEESIDKLHENLYCYANLQWDLDKRNDKFKDMSERLSQSHNLFIVEVDLMEKNILKIHKSKLLKFLKQKNMNQVKERLEMIVDHKSKISRQEEKVLKMVEGIFDSFSQIHQGVEMKIKFPRINVSQKRFTLTHNNLHKFTRHKKKNVRKQAYLSFLNGYANNESTFTDLLKKHISSKHIDSKIRKEPSLIDHVLKYDDIKQSSVDAVCESVSSNKKIAQEYLKLIKKNISSTQFYAYDEVTTGLDNDQKYPYSKAIDLLVESVEYLGEDTEKIIKKAFKEGWVDARNLKTKLSLSNAGYSYNPIIRHPYIFMNYSQNFDSVLTLAHEMGHAIHATRMNNSCHFYRTHVSYIVQESIAFTHELLTAYTALDKARSIKAKKGILFEILTLYYTNLYKKTINTEFERFLNLSVENGDNLRSETLNKKYYEILKQYKSPVQKINEVDGRKWMTTDVFYYDFYEAKYTLAFASASHFVSKIRENDVDFIAKFKTYQSKGSTYKTNHMLKELDVDIINPQNNINDAFKVMKDLLDEYNSL